MDSNIGDVLLPMLILVILGAVGIGGWLVWVFVRSRNRSATPAAANPASSPGNAEELPFLVLRRTQFGDWEILVRGQRYRTMQAVPEEADRQEVVEALKVLAAFARDYLTRAEQQEKPASPPAESPQPQAPVTPTPAPETVATAPASAVASAPAAAARTENARRSSAARQTTGADTLMPQINLAEEIGEIVDELIEQAPVLQKHAVRLMNAPGGGVNFAVDGTVYEDIEEIPYPEVQALIRHATKEWERR